MREILFRGKRVSDGEWLLGSLICYTRKGELVCCIHGYYYSHAIDPATVGQYTGLTDKNGKKIFEGDIVRAKFCGKHQGTFTIEFINGCFYAVPAGGTIDSLRPWKFSMGGENENMEVIGNVHDNGWEEGVYL